MKIELKQRKDETLHGRRLYLVSQWKALRNSWWSNERIICNTLCNIVRQFYISRRLSRPLSLILLAQSLLLPLSSSWPPPSSSSLTPPPPHDLINVDGIVCLSLHRRYWSQMVATVINWSFQNIQDYLVGILKLHLKGPLLIVICHNARSKVEKAQTFLSHFNEMNLNAAPIMTFFPLFVSTTWVPQPCILEWFFLFSNVSACHSHAFRFIRWSHRCVCVCESHMPNIFLTQWGSNVRNKYSFTRNMLFSLVHSFCLCRSITSARVHSAVANARGDVINLFARIFNLVLQTFISVCERVFFYRARESFLSVYLSISYGFFALATDLIRFVLFIIYVRCVCTFFVQLVCTSYTVNPSIDYRSVLKIMDKFEMTTSNTKQSTAQSMRFVVCACIMLTLTEWLHYLCI